MSHARKEHLELSMLIFSCLLLDILQSATEKAHGEVEI
jgi:hypothetical protein